MAGKQTSQPVKKYNPSTVQYSLANEELTNFKRSVNALYFLLQLAIWLLPMYIVSQIWDIKQVKPYAISLIVLIILNLVIFGFYVAALFGIPWNFKWIYGGFALYNLVYLGLLSAILYYFMTLEIKIEQIPYEILIVAITLSFVGLFMSVSLAIGAPNEEQLQFRGFTPEEIDAFNKWKGKNPGKTIKQFREDVQIAQSRALQEVSAPAPATSPATAQTTV